MTKSSPSAAEQRIVIGKAGAPHGIAGELRIVPLTDFPERFQSMKQVYVGDELLDIVSVRYHQRFVIMRFAQYPTREAAARLTCRLLRVERAQAAPVAEGEYYTFDIIGLSVFDPEGQALGTITNVLKTGSNDVYVASPEDGGQQLLIPALRKVVKEIDLAAGRMVVDMPEELD